MLGGVEQFRQPEYTGENRCLPCTVLNLLVGVAASAVLGASVSPGVGAVALATFGTVIYLRGYLVPGTPTITARYFPRWLLAAFGKEPRAEPPEDIEDGLRLLEANRVVERTPSTGVRLRPAFRAAWNERIRERRGRELDAEGVADLLGVSPDGVSEMRQNAFVVGGERLVEWASDAALLADVAAGEELRARCPIWEELDADERKRLLTRLRAARDRCPDCDEPLSASERTITSCCRPAQTVRSVTCNGCEALIAERRSE